MRHPDASLAAYVEGTATARERATAEAHLASCPDCRREVKRAKAALAALGQLPELEAPSIDAAAIIGRVTAARAARAKRPAAAGAATLASVSTQEWAPATPTTVAEEAAQADAEPPSAVVEDLEVARRRRDRDRSRALRVAEAALGTAAILVAAVLFIGLRNQPSAERAATGGGAESAASPPATFDSGAVADYNPLSLTSHAKTLASEINNAHYLSAQEQALAGPTPAERTVTNDGVSCVQRATGGLVSKQGLYELLRATYLGQPAWIGAFITDADTDTPTLIVVAVPVDGCTTEQVQQIIREPLEPASPASP